MIRASSRYLEGHGFDSPLGAQKILFWNILTWERFFIIYTLSKSSIHLSFIHIYNFDTLSLAVWQDTCHTYKNLVYDLAHHEFAIAQWLERPTGIWKVMGSTPVGGSENSFSEYFDLRTLLHYENVVFSALWYTYHSCAPKTCSLCLRSLKRKVRESSLKCSSCLTVNCYVSQFIISSCVTVLQA